MLIQVKMYQCEGEIMLLVQMLIFFSSLFYIVLYSDVLLFSSLLFIYSNLSSHI